MTRSLELLVHHGAAEVEGEVSDAGAKDNADEEPGIVCHDNEHKHVSNGQLDQIENGLGHVEQDANGSPAMKVALGGDKALGEAENMITQKRCYINLPNERMTECINEWMYIWMNEWIYYECMYVWMKEWLNELKKDP